MEQKDPQGPKPFDYVAQMKNMNEVSRKNKVTQLKWLNEYQWLCDEYKKVEDEMKILCATKNATYEQADLKKDDRHIKPVPETSNGVYGWLAAKNDFSLEKYGSYIVNYPNPLDSVTLLSGNIPRIAAGKGLI